MGTVKSIRFNKEIENMFNTVKDYKKEKDSNITDTKIITDGIKLQYEYISKNLNNNFREKMLERLSKDENTKNVFEQAANILEILSISIGSTLKREFLSFLFVNTNENSVFSIDDKKIYEKVYETLKKTFDKDTLSNAIIKINSELQKLKE